MLGSKRNDRIRAIGDGYYIAVHDARRQRYTLWWKTKVLSFHGVEADAMQAATRDQRYRKSLG